MPLKDSPSVPSRSVSKSVFIPAFVIPIVCSALFMFIPEQSGQIAADIMGWIATTFGWLYLLFGMGALVFCLWLGFGRFSHVTLGPSDAKPEYSNLQWIAMMFTAGIGAGLVSWSFAEPVYYLSTPPYGIEPLSPTAFEWAHMYPFLHWGIVPWAFYVIPAVPVAYALYVRRIPALRMSETCLPMLPRTGRKPIKALIDVFIILGIIGGTTTSLGIGVPLVSALLTELTGLDNNFGLKISVLIFWVILFGTSTLRGLKAGIQRLAEINMGLVGFVLIAMLVFGPTVFILKISVNSFGLMLDNFFRSSLWTDPIASSGFVESWTIFYWGWWIAFAAFVGLFIGRISRGRTIRQVVVGTLLWGTLGTWTYMAVAGGYALHLQLSGTLDLVEILNQNDLYVLTAKIAANMPAGQLSLCVFLVLCIVFYATTMDSAAFVISSVCTKELPVGTEPPLYLRLIWIGVIFAVTTGLLLSNSLSAVQSFTVISALPLIPILLIMCASVVKWLNADHPEKS